MCIVRSLSKEIVFATFLKIEFSVTLLPFCQFELNSRYYKTFKVIYFINSTVHLIRNIVRPQE